MHAPNIQLYGTTECHQNISLWNNNIIL